MSPVFDTSPKRTASTDARPETTPPSPVTYDPRSDPRYQSLAKAQEEFEKHVVKHGNDLVGGARRNLANSEKERSEYAFSLLSPTSWFASGSGFNATLEQQVNADRGMLSRREQNQGKIEGALHQSKMFTQQSLFIEKRGHELLNAGKTEEAKKAFEEADKLRKSSLSALRGSAGIDTREYQQALGKINAGLDNVAANLKTTEVVMRTTRDGLIIAGATIATGGAAGIGVAGAGLTLSSAGVGLAAGSGFSLVAGAASNTAEGFSAVGHGTKTKEQAVNDAVKGTVQDLKNGTIASASTLVGAGVLAKLPAALPGATAATKIATFSKNTAISGSAAGGFSNVTRLGTDLTTGDRSFVLSASNEQKKLDPRIVDLRSALVDLSRDLIGGFVGGKLGGRIGLARSGVLPTSTSALLATRAGAVGTGLLAEEIAAPLAGRQVTAESRIAALTATITGVATGNAAKFIAPQKPAVTAAPAPPVKSATPPPPERVVPTSDKLPYRERSAVVAGTRQNPLDRDGIPNPPEFSKADLRSKRFMFQPEGSLLERPVRRPSPLGSAAKHPDQTHIYKEALLEQYLKNKNLFEPHEQKVIDAALNSGAIKVSQLSRKELLGLLDQDKLIWKEQNVSRDVLDGITMPLDPRHVRRAEVRGEGPVIMVDTGEKLVILNGNNRIYKTLFENPGKHPVFAIKVDENTALGEIFGFDAGKLGGYTDVPAVKPVITGRTPLPPLKRN